MEITRLSKDDFMQLPQKQLASLVKNSGSSVCAFPINGTRRWFMLEHADIPQGVDAMSYYMEMAGQEHIRVFTMIFDQGISTILSPTFGPDIMERGEEYTRMAADGMRHLVEDPKFLDFYETYEVRVRFYGEYRKYFAGTDFEPLCDLFDELSDRTAHFDKNRLFWGLFAHDAVQPIAELSVQYYQETGNIPQKEDLISAYYGEDVSPVDFFVGFDKFASFDMPLLTTGEEDLYFTVAPSLYITEEQFREILYDHLFTRKLEETNYEGVNNREWSQMHAFYQANMGNTQGIGHYQQQGQFWYPESQLNIPQHIKDEAL